MKGLRLSEDKRQIVTAILLGWTIDYGDGKTNEEILNDIIENDIEIM